MAILYCPTKAKVSKKMIYSTTYGSLNSRLLRNIYYEMVCDDPSELSKEHILKRVKKEKKIWGIYESLNKKRKKLLKLKNIIKYILLIF